MQINSYPGTDESREDNINLRRSLIILCPNSGYPPVLYTWPVVLKSNCFRTAAPARVQLFYDTGSCNRDPTSSPRIYGPTTPDEREICSPRDFIVRGATIVTVTRTAKDETLILWHACHLTSYCLTAPYVSMRHCRFRFA